MVAQRLKQLHAMRETWFDPWVMKIHWRRKWQPTPVFLPGESHGQRSLVGYSPWSRKESDTTERLHFHFCYIVLGKKTFSPTLKSCLTLGDPMASLTITNSRSLLKLISIDLVVTSNHLILCHPLLLMPSNFPSIRVFSSESALRIRWPKYWSFSFNISPSSEHPGLISFRMDWLDLLAVQGTLKSLLQHHSSKASILWCSAFFIVQLSHPYMPLEKP